MSNEWNALLAQFGGVVEAGNPTHFPHTVSADKAALCDLSYRGLISVRGSEAQTFLARQFTADILNLGPNQSQLSGYCSQKGRLLAVFRLFIHEGAICLEMPRSLVEPILKRLRMFVLRADVALEDSSETLVRIGLLGEDLNDQPPMHQPQLTTLSIPGVLPRFEIIGSPTVMQQYWQELARTRIAIDSRLWEQQDILAGLPVIFPQTAEAFVPQMVNLQLVGGVSFTKGCYPGQEIVARTQYLGTLKRRMYLLHSDNGDLPAPGDFIFSATDSEQKTGTVVHAQASASGTDLLAVVEIQATEAGNLRLGAPTGPLLTVRPLPYGDQPT